MWNTTEKVFKQYKLEMKRRIHQGAPKNMENGQLIFISKKTYHNSLIIWTLRNSGIVQNRVAQMRYSKILREMTFAQNAVFSRKKFMQRKQIFTFLSARIAQLFCKRKPYTIIGRTTEPAWGRVLHRTNLAHGQMVLIFYWFLIDFVFTSLQVIIKESTERKLQVLN